MSLNGLDDVKVKEAHDAAIAEPGGWFLLKYTSRDEVDLLGRGNGGIVEVRNAIASYAEPSPLFGFLRYRRRNVLINYVPEDCSRLLQARVMVHFNAVTERFSPHDIIFPIATSKDLQDSTLSAACSLHTASGSVSSSTSSLRRRRLMEIAEDEEEENRVKRQSTVHEERPSTAGRSNHPAEDEPPLPTATSAPEASPPPVVPRIIATLPPIKSLETSPPPPRERESVDEPPPRLSSQSTRPDFFSSSSYSLKPKIKLGPRPSLDAGKKRPHTSATSQYRPVSTLPAGLKIFSKGSKRGRERPKSTCLEEGSSTQTPEPVATETLDSTLQIMPVRPHTSGGRPNTSSGVSLNNIPTSPMIANTAKLPTITPEKARLLKALELRKKQKTKSTVSQAPTTANEGASGPPPTIPEDSVPESSEAAIPPKDTSVVDTIGGITDTSGLGITFETASAPKTDESDATRSDSYPTSPIEPSSKAESTRASSVSEATDETVLPSNEKEDAVVQDNSRAQADAEPVLEATTIDDEKSTDLEPTATEDVEKPNEAPPPADNITEVEQSTEDKAEVEAQTEQVEEQISESPLEPTNTTKDTAPEQNLHPAAVEERAPEVEMTINTAETEDCAAEPVTDVVTQEAGCVGDVTQPSREDEAAEAPEAAYTVVSEGPNACEPVEALPATSPKKELKFPRSKFSIPDLKAASNIAPTTESLPTSTSQTSLNAGVDSIRSKFFVQDRKDSETENATEDSEASTPKIEQQGTESVSKQTKRRALIEPIRTNLELDENCANSEANFSSDDDLMEELQSAVVQEAKPMSVSKSPMSPVFPSPVKAERDTSRFSRAFSNPLRRDSAKSEMLSPPDNTPGSSRSVSASAYLNRISQLPAAPAAKKVNLGSGISQRIKALEQLSSQAPGPSPAPGTSGPTTGSSTAFFAVRKSMVRPPSRSPSIAERANSLTKNTPEPSRDSSPEVFKMRERSPSVQNRIESMRPSPIPSSQPSRPRPESVSVTARIIRDPNQPYPQKPDPSKDPSEYAPLDLKQSPLVIDHRKASTMPNLQTKDTIQERRLSREQNKDRRSSISSTITVVKDMINEKRNSFAEHRRSITLDREPTSPVKSPKPPSAHSMSAFRRPMSMVMPPAVSSPTMSPTATARSSSSISDKSEKKSSRAGRMLRRMSSTLANGRKNITHSRSPTLREEAETVPNDIDTRSVLSGNPSHTFMVHAPTLSDVGDVNVQFPDTLLWKRRAMGLDSQGFLVLAPALSTNKAGDKTTTRRFHLNEFKTPMIPDVEMQELPNSVVLDFLDGGALQIACEDRASQGRVLRVLQDAHRMWASDQE
ncbi:hypothetical protein BP6252_00714 [Coleophoma cylindrospora]|uniref:ADF-H domain-containing protein n=1 Tax=Coleophoma cylindrospora TaxID=1849047 RepID=A0A3D8SQW7_9HELO|nr:hypothetical protein BP6252_00714 [Coleophoma cylindrospora]